MSFMELAKARYSVRAFLDKAVEQEKIDRILEAAKIAPTAKNNQPQRIYVLKSKEALAQAAETSPCIYGAPLIFMVCVDETEVYQTPQLKSGDVDTSIVGTHMMLEAWEQGLGSVWVLKFDPAKAKEIFQLPENIRPVFLLPVGYASPEAKPSDRHESYRPMSEMVFEL